MSADDRLGAVPGTSAIAAAAVHTITAADPSELARHAGLSLFDFATCVRGGRDRKPAAWARDPERLALEAHALDRDDVHPDALVHPGGIVWPALITAARGRDVDGADAVRGAALGYDICIAAARLLGSEGRRFWHSTAVAGTVGAAAAAAWIESGPDYLASAMGHAFSIAGGSITAMTERSDTRFVHRAHAAAAGLLAAQAACSGIDGTRFVLEPPQGFLAAVRSDAELLASTAAQPAIAETAQRLHATSGFAQAAFDAAHEIGPLAPDQIDGVTIEVSGAGALLASSGNPSNDVEAWWSIPHAVAVGLTSHDAEDLERGLSRDADVRRLASRCSVVAARSDLGATVRVKLGAADDREAEIVFARGHPMWPLTRDQRVRKWELLGGSDGADALAAALDLGEVPLAVTVRRLLGES